MLKQLSPSPALSSTSFSPKKKLEHARALLSILLTFGISEGIDTICNEGLAIKPASATLGLFRYLSSNGHINRIRSNQSEQPRDAGNRPATQLLKRMDGVPGSVRRQGAGDAYTAPISRAV